MEIVRIESSDHPAFEKICEWNYRWWGLRDHRSLEEVRCNMAHSLCVGDRLPQTFVAMTEGQPVGMYQLSMMDDLDSRPDIYPWLINVYVDESFRRKGICGMLMRSVQEHARAAGLRELYLYTSHTGLYERFGWRFVEEVRTFREDSPVERLYRLRIQA